LSERKEKRREDFVSDGRFVGEGKRREGNRIDKKKILVDWVGMEASNCKLVEPTTQKTVPFPPLSEMTHLALHAA